MTPFDTTFNKKASGNQAGLVALALAFLILAVAVVIIRNLVQTSREVQEMYSESIQGIKVSGDLMSQIQDARLHSLYTLSSTDPNVQLESADASRACDPRVTGLLLEHSALMAKTDNHGASLKLPELWAEFRKVRDQVLAAVLEGSRDEGLQVDRRAGLTAFNNLHAALEQSEKVHSRQAAVRLEQIQTVSRRNILIVGLMLTLVLVGAGVALRTLERNAKLLVRSRERFELAVAGSSDGIWDWNVATNEGYFSDRWCELLGYAPGELPPHFKTWAAHLHPDDKNRALAAVQAHLEQHTPYDLEYRMRAKSGEHRWFHASGQAKWDQAGKPLRMAGSLTDITERKQVDASLRETLTMQRAIFDAASHAIISTGLDGTVRSFNRAAELMLGYEASEIVGRTSPALWHDGAEVANRAAVLTREMKFPVAPGFESFVAKARLNLPDENEWTIIRKDGSRLSGLLSATAMREASGEITGFLGIIADITARKSSEAEMGRLNRELMDASRQAGMAEIATGILHNVGNVLNSVNISSSIVVEQLRKSKTPSLARAAQLLTTHKDDVGQFLTQDPKGKQLPGFFVALSEQLTREQAMLTKEMQGLQQNIDHIKQIVAMQQSYAKVSGVLEKLAPHELVEDALRMSSTALARHQIEVVRQFDPVPPALVDRHKVLQILVNLISNAKQALDDRPEGRRLTLRIAPGEGDSARVEVSDNGAGIPKENLARIFNHGFTTKKTGHGFGLHSGANAAKEMGGSLGVRSDGEGTGATFILELPLSQMDAQRSSQSADECQKQVNRAA